MALLFLLARTEKKENYKSVDLQCLNGEVIYNLYRLFFNNQSTNKQTQTVLCDNCMQDKTASCL